MSVRTLKVGAFGVRPLSFSRIVAPFRLSNLVAHLFQWNIMGEDRRFSVAQRILEGLSPFLVIGLVVLISLVPTVVTVVSLGGATPSAARVTFSTPRLMGYPTGDDWEPAVASDGAGNVYLLITHFGGVPGCSGCASPTIMVQVSHDSGKTFSSPTPVVVSSSLQYDPQVTINAAGTVFISYLLGKDTVVQSSADHGVTWTSPVVVNVGMRQGLTDKDGLAVSGSNVYVGFDVAQRFFVGSSHDRGKTFSVTMMNNATTSNNATIGWTLNGGGAVAPDGTVYMVWESYQQSGNALGLQAVLITESTDQGGTWTMHIVDQGLPPGPDCGWPTGCGWAFLGTGTAIAVDGSGTVYVAYNAPTYFQGPPTIWFRASRDGGTTWSPRMPANGDGTPSFHVFPAITAGAAGDVRVGWMDNRTGRFNVWYRSSSNYGATGSWSSEVRVSQYSAGRSYVAQNGFAWPYGDYFILNLDPKGTVHLAWGEGPSYSGPGNVLYAHS